MRNVFNCPLARTVIVALITVCSFCSLGQVIDQGFLSPLVVRQALTVAISKGPGKKLYIAGDIDFHGTTYVKQVVRIHSDGSLDPTFKADLPIYSNGSVLAMDVLPNGKVVILIQGQVSGSIGVYILDKNGAQLIEPDFGLAHYSTCIAALPDNTFLLGGGSHVAHYNENGQYLSDYLYVDGDNPLVNDIDVEGSKIIISGSFSYVTDALTRTSIPRENVARFNLDGTLDYGFNANAAIQTYGAVGGVCVQPDQKVILEKKYIAFNSTAATSMRVNADGSPDTQFNSNFPSTLTIDEAHYNNGKITIANKSKIARLNIDGTLDTSFKPVSFPPAKVNLSVLIDDFVVAANYPTAVYGITKISPIGVPSITYKAELTRSGIINAMDRTAVSIYIGGDFIKVNNHLTRNVARLNLNGTVLTKFKVTIDPGVVTQVEGFSNAKALINTSTTLMRLKHDGTFDPGFNFTAFGGLTKVSKFIMQDDGRILIGAPSKIFRLNADGSRDNSFNSAIGGFSQAKDFDFDLDRPTGKILFSGVFDGQPSYATRNITRLNSDGSIDPAFTPEITFSEYGAVARVIFLDNLESIILTINNGRRQPTKLYADGSVDAQFIDNFNVNNVRYQPHKTIQRFGERIIMGGYSFYDQSLAIDTFFDDGHLDGFFELPVGVGQFYDFFADNDQELFVLGVINYPDVSSPRQMAKILDESAIPGSLESADLSQMSFHPNPAGNYITFDNANEVTVTIYNFTGEAKIKASVTSEMQPIDIRNLTKGHYVIHAVTKDRTRRMHLIKE